MAARGSGKRERITPRGDSRFARRDGQGRFSEMDDVGRSLAQDRKRKAKTKAKPGYGDRGDRQTSSRASSGARRGRSTGAASRSRSGSSRSGTASRSGSRRTSRAKAGSR